MMAMDMKVLALHSSKRNAVIVKRKISLIKVVFEAPRLIQVFIDRKDNCAFLVLFDHKIRRKTVSEGNHD
jgi:hypothetical protein